MSVLVMVGSPGVGKSSISIILANRLKGRRVSIGDLVEHEGLDCGLDTKRGTKIADTERIEKRIRGIVANSEGLVIVEGHFAMDVVRVEDVLYAFVLRRNPIELRGILEKRGFPQKKITENVAAEILDVCLYDAVQAYGERKTCEVDVSGRNAEEVTEELIDVVRGRRKPRIGIVDWLTQLEIAGRLDEFLDTL